jgi:hypothetical protein
MLIIQQMLGEIIKNRMLQYSYEIREHENDLQDDSGKSLYFNS